jgi:hypothetical protein
MADPRDKVVNMSPAGMSLFPWPSLISPMWTLDDHFTLKRDREKPEPADSSAALFTMYSQMAEKEHKETAERWQKDADGILIFVSPQLHFHLTSHVMSKMIDWPILCCCCGVGRGGCPRPQAAKFPGYLGILSREHISASRRGQWFSSIHPCPSYAATPLSPKLRQMGQRSLVLELKYKPYICHAGDNITTVCPSIPQGHSEASIQST